MIYVPIGTPLSRQKYVLKSSKIKLNEIFFYAHRASLQLVVRTSISLVGVAAARNRPAGYGLRGLKPSVAAACHLQPVDGR